LPRTSCTLCGGSVAVRFPAVLDPQTRESFRILACEDCGLGQTFPQPENLGRYYGPAYHGGRHGFTAQYCARRRIGFTQRVTGAARGRRLLDIGCGDGTFLLAARARGWRIAGTETHPSIARAEGLLVWTELEEAQALAPYSCITLWQSLEHMRRPREFLDRVVRLLEPNGTMLVGVPNAEGLQASVFGARWFHLDVPRHLFHFGPRSLAKTLEASGLRVTRSFHLEAELELFGWTQSALNSIFATPNVFFSQLTGRATDARGVTKLASFAAGIAFSALAAPFTPAGPLASKGAILTMAARKPADADRTCGPASAQPT
jgi:SAM-dependent methyltransferase